MSPAFFKKPMSHVVVRGGPPDIPRNVIPVLRKPPIVLIHKHAAKARPKRKAAQAPKPATKPVPQGTKKIVVKPVLPKTAPRPTTPKPEARKADRVEQRTPPGPAKHEIPRNPTSPAPLASPPDVPASPRRPEEHAFAPSRATPLPLTREAVDVHPIRERGLTQTGLLGGALLIVGIVAIILYYATPWIDVTDSEPVGPSPFDGMEPGPKGASDLAPASQDSTYFARLVDWPVLAILMSALVGLGLAGTDQIPRMRVDRHRRVQTAGLAILFFLGFVELLTGARWIGLYVSTLIDDGDAPAHLLVFPYLALALGVAQSFLVERLFRKKAALAFGSASNGRNPTHRIAPWSVVAAALTLVFIPVVPLGVLETADGNAFLQEGELESDATPAAGGLEDATDALRFARGLFWVCFYLAIAATLIAASTRQDRPLLHSLYVLTYGAMLPAVLSALVATIIAQVGFAGIEGAATFLAIPFAGVSALAAIYVVYVRDELIPYVRRLPTLPE